MARRSSLDVVLLGNCANCLPPDGGCSISFIEASIQRWLLFKVKTATAILLINFIELLLSVGRWVVEFYCAVIFIVFLLVRQRVDVKLPTFTVLITWNALKIFILLNLTHRLHWIHAFQLHFYTGRTSKNKLTVCIKFLNQNFNYKCLWLSDSQILWVARFNSWIRPHPLYALGATRVQLLDGRYAGDWTEILLVT